MIVRGAFDGVVFRLFLLPSRESHRRIGYVSLSELAIL